MTLVNIKYRENVYTLASDNPDKLQNLANKFNKRVEEIAANSNNATDIKLAVTTALILEDEIESLKAELTEAKNKDQEVDDIIEETLADTVDQLANYIEKLAHKLEKR
jgi:cell division protein ZapA (FtsZ GTPase activity inhibitor)